MAELVTLEGLDGGCRKCGGGKSRSADSGNNITINVQGATATNNNAAEQRGGRQGRPQGLSPEPQAANNDTAVSKMTEILKQITETKNRPPDEGLSPNVPPQVVREVVQKPVFIPTIVEKIKTLFKPYAIPTEKRVKETVQSAQAIPTERRTVETRQSAQAIPTEKRVKETVQVDRPRFIDRIKNRWIVVRQNQPQPPNFP